MSETRFQRRPAGTTRLGAVAVGVALAAATAVAVAGRAASAPAGATRLALIGTINGASPFHMRLEAADGKVTGSYAYDAHGTDIPLRGTLAEDGALSLEELDRSGAVAATFEGKRGAAGAFAGEWKRPGRPAGLPFAADVDRSAGAPPSEAAAWNGLRTFVGSTQYDESTVTTTGASTAAVEFDLASRSGGHEGDIAGTAKVAGSRATWKDEETTCSVALERRQDAIEVAVTGDCSALVALGAQPADGEYRRAQSPRQLTLVDSGALADATAEKALARLAGSDYPLFLACFQLVSEDKDLDGLGATVASGGVRGLFTIQEGIVMCAPGGKLWAAAIDPATEEVRYYSSDPAWRRKLPRTIESWRKGFADKKVVFAPR